MIQHWDLVGSWYEIAQYICYGVIAIGIVVAIYDCIKKKVNNK